MTLQALSSLWAKKPLTTTALLFVAIVVFHVAGEFGAGFLDGLVIGFNDGI